MGQIEYCVLCKKEHEPQMDCTPEITGLLKYLPKDFKVDDDYWDLPEADGIPNICDLDESVIHSNNDK
jgi:hypothetical protein